MNTFRGRLGFRHRFVWPLLAALGVAAMTGTASGHEHAGQDAPAVNDEKVPQPDRRKIQQALDRFKQNSDGRWRVAWDERTGLPRTIRGGMTRVYPGAPRKAAEDFLADNKTLYGLDQAHYTLRHFESKETRAGHRITFVQQYRKLDVVHARLAILVDPEGRVLHSATTVWPVKDVVIEPTLSGRQAIGLVERRFAPELDAEWTEPMLAIYPRGAGRLAYLVNQQLGDTTLPWEFAIDAQTGDLLERRQVIKDAGGKPATRPGAEPGEDEGTAPQRKSQGLPDRPVQPLGPPPDPCDREWTIIGPAGETTITEPGVPADPYEVDIMLGVSSFGVAETGTQIQANYAGGLTLLPCIDYTVSFDWDLHTWDSYGSFDGFWDVFFVHANSVDFYSNIVFPDPIADLACSTLFNPIGFIDLPGPLWTFGGLDWGDEILCSSAGSFAFMYQETDSTLTVYVSVGLDTGITGDVDGQFPSWGTFHIEIDAQSHVFNPNPVTVLNDNTLTDQGDINGAVACTAYTAVDLANLTAPGAGAPWTLTGTYCMIADLATPAGETAVAFTPPTSRNDDFPYIRDCDAFEAVMCYHHVDTNQTYIQALGFANVNNRQIQIDPHSFVADQSYYVPDGAGTGHLTFGDGGTDDAEDADVIIHEYGHSIQDNQNVGAFSGANNNGFGNETGAIGEAFGDYWACSAANAASQASGFNAALFAEWDAPPNGLRNLATNKTYPTGMGNGIHKDGEIWSGSLWDIFQILGKTVTDTLVLESHFWVPNNPDFVDNAEAILFADLLLYGSINELIVAEAFVNRGIFRKLTVQSFRDGAAIEVDTADVLGDDDGSAAFERIYGYGEAVSLTAPAMHGGKPFSRWKLNGVPQAAGNNPLAVNMTQAHTALAIFGSLVGDIDDDGIVGILDFLSLLSLWGPCDDPCPPACPGDFNGDCTVGISDFLDLLGGWG